MSRMVGQDFCRYGTATLSESPRRLTSSHLEKVSLRIHILRALFVGLFLHYVDGRNDEIPSDRRLYEELVKPFHKKCILLKRDLLELRNSTLRKAMKRYGAPIFRAKSNLISPITSS